MCITARTLQKNRKQFGSKRKRSPTLDPGNCLAYTSILNTFLYKIKSILPRSLENDDSYVGFWKDDKRNLFGVNQEDLLEIFAGQYYQGLLI